jgi:hypothetical protein
MPDPNQQDASELFSTAWVIGIPDGNPNLQVVSKILAKKIEGAADNGGVYIWSTILAIRQCRSDQPTAIDFMLQAYAEASKLLPETVKNEYGSGTAAAIKQLK